MLPVSREKYNAVVAERDELQDTLKQLREQSPNTELETRTAELEALGKELETRATELETLNTELETRNAELQTSNSELETRATELETRNTELETLVANLGQIDDSIANAQTNDEKITAIRTLLAAKPASAAAQFQGNDASKSADGVDWETINKLPHNQNID